MTRVGEDYLERELNRFTSALENLKSDDINYSEFEEKREARRRFLKEKIKSIQLQLGRLDTQKAFDETVDYEVVVAHKP